MGFLDILTGNATLVVGIEDTPDGALKVYIDARYLRRYVVATDPDEIAEVRRAWNSSTGHVFMRTPPPEVVMVDPPAPSKDPHAR